MAQKQQNLTIIINDMVKEIVSIDEGEGMFIIPCEKDADMMVILQSDYAAKLSDPDTRIASWHLSDIKCVE